MAIVPGSAPAHQTQFFGALLVGAVLLVGGAVFLTQRPVWMNGEVIIPSLHLSAATARSHLLPDDSCLKAPRTVCKERWDGAGGACDRQRVRLHWILDDRNVVE